MAHNNELKILMRKTGLTLKQIAKELGMSHVQVIKWGTGKHRPRPENLVALYRLLRKYEVNVDFIDLFKIVFEVKEEND